MTDQPTQAWITVTHDDGRRWQDSFGATIQRSADLQDVANRQLASERCLSGTAHSVEVVTGWGRATASL